MMPTSAIVARCATRGVTVQICVRAAPAGQRRLYATGEQSAQPAESAESAKKHRLSSLDAAKARVQAAQAALKIQRQRAEDTSKARKAKAKAAATLKKERAAAKTAKAKAKKEKAATEKPKRSTTSLKQLALQPPIVQAASGRGIYIKELGSAGLTKGEGESSVSYLTRISKAHGDRWQALSDEERSRYRERAEERKVAQVSAFKEWYNGQGASTIERANRARATLRKEGTRGNWDTIRKPSVRTITGYQKFLTELIASRDAGESAAEAFVRAGKEWRSLEESEKEAYRRAAKSASAVTESSGGPLQAAASG